MHNYKFCAVKKNHKTLKLTKKNFHGNVLFQRFLTKSGPKWAQNEAFQAI